MREPGIQSVFSDAVRGDSRAFTELYRRYHRMLVRYLRPQVPGSDEQLAYETWVATAPQLDGFQGDERDFRSLLLAQADAQMSKQLRTSQRAASPPESCRVIDLRYSALEEEPVADATIADLLHGLSPHQAHILLLRVVGGLSADETARLLHQTAATIRLTEHEALQQIAQRLRREQTTATKRTGQEDRVLSGQLP